MAMTELAKKILQFTLLHYQERLTHQVIVMELQCDFHMAIAHINGLEKAGLLERVSGTYKDAERGIVNTQYIIPTREAFRMANLSWVDEEWMHEHNLPKQGYFTLNRQPDPDLSGKKKTQYYICPYCNSMFDKFHTNCTNCGAPLTKENSYAD